ncbi:DUF4260 domain-containing protein [Halospeciosus flavus]|uniref:DUF4260 domain-containing protein n=1 Tax=Halospeciosus flavus TaxID=3032283 RepID=A0ABD5Z1P5_9EURY|nr:DUF4260 domain-containing protein [Halospeciosus flavus]
MDDFPAVRRLLNVEGAAVFLVALASYVSLGGPWWLLVVLALAPDLSMVGYLVGERVGAAAYNAVHTYVGPLVLGAVGVWGDHRLALLVALVWAGHVGADRAVGYGLKYATGFGDTHLDRV